MPRLTVQFFAVARQRAGRDAYTLEVAAPGTVTQLLSQLVVELPALASLVPHLRVAVDQEFATAEQLIPEGAEVALIPPVAGGSPEPLARVVDRPLSLDEVVAAVASPARGGVVTFTGTVRSPSKGKAIARLEYEAYAPMAEKQLRRIIEEAQARWPGVEVAVVHRVGVLLPGEAAVVIAVAAPHRGEAFAACQYTIDRLKEDVPIWKKEVATDGEVWVGLGP